MLLSVSLFTLLTHSLVRQHLWLLRVMCSITLFLFCRSPQFTHLMRHYLSCNMVTIFFSSLKKTISQHPRKIYVKNFISIKKIKNVSVDQLQKVNVVNCPWWINMTCLLNDMSTKWDCIWHETNYTAKKLCNKIIRPIYYHLCLLLRLWKFSITMSEGKENSMCQEYWRSFLSQQFWELQQELKCHKRKKLQRGHLIKFLPTTFSDFYCIEDH